MELVVAQCDLGPRTPGSEANRRLRDMIADLAREHGLKVSTLCFDAPDPMSDRTLSLCNLVVSAGPAGGERLWLGGPLRYPARQ